MKEKFLNFIFCLFCFTSIIIIFKNNTEIAEVIIKAVNLFLKKVFVSLFPMFILNDLFISLNIPYYFYLLFNKLFIKVFKTSGIGCYVFIMSLISGTPSNAYILKELVIKKTLTPEEASHLLAFTYFSNPLFLTIMLNNLFTMAISIKIMLIHYISNIIIGLILRNKAPKISESNFQVTSPKIGSTLIKSINKSINTLLMILGTITFYMLLTYIITSIIPTNPFLKTITGGFLEITNGLNTLTNLEINSKIKEIIAIAIISFGGLSIHTQIKAILEDTKIIYNFFLKGRIIHVIIGIILVCII